MGIIEEGIQATQGAINDVVGLIQDNKTIAIGSAIGAGAIALGVAGVVAATNGTKSKRKTSKKRRNRDRIFKSKQKHERKYKRKRKYKVYGRKGYINPRAKRKKARRTSSTRTRKVRRSTRRVYYAKKTGQPYILKANGQAKFIKGKRRK